jgi:GntR family transcriptional regulator
VLPAERVVGKLLAVESVEIGELLRDTLCLATGSMRVVEFLVLVDDEPLCLLAAYLPEGVDEELVTNKYESVAVSFQRLIGRPLGKVSTTIEAINADPFAASVLGVAPGAALILREQVLHDPDGKVALLTFARYRGDRVALTASN